MPWGKWDNQIAFLPSEICEIIGLARCTISEYNTIRLRERKIGKHYRIRRAALEVCTGAVEARNLAVGMEARLNHGVQRVGHGLFRRHVVVVGVG